MGGGPPYFLIWTLASTFLVVSQLDLVALCCPEPLQRRPREKDVPVVEVLSIWPNKCWLEAGAGTRNVTSVLSVLEVWTLGIVVKPLTRTFTVKSAMESCLDHVVMAMARVLERCRLISIILKERTTPPVPLSLILLRSRLSLARDAPAVVVWCMLQSKC
uniref:Secreted protein n=1 Tax=Cacopsylla melanoneura TaxID=428564 RepID=A0A8D8UFZ7_9HEMI